MITRTAAISRYLTAVTHSDLAQLYNSGMEVQVNVARGNGEQEKGEYKGREYIVWTDGIERWKALRIPYKAMSEPEYKDVPMSYSLEKHAEGIGMTGWCWLQRKSVWVAFDFDAIVGHSEAHKKKLSDDELKKILQVVSDIPWVTLRKSTAGRGIHLYIFLDYVPTANHTEHAALARAILNMLSALTGYEFSSKVDTCGGNMWVWHRKMAGTDGLTLIKAGTEVLKNIPHDWRNHVPVVSNRTARITMQEIKDPDAFDQLAGQRAKITLDANHKRLLTWLQENKTFWWWDNDMWMLVTHTTHLKAAHEQLKFQGRFETNSSGSNSGHDHNCYAFPLRNGSWVVRRYTPGTAEASTWQIDSKGWTRCFYNRKMDFGTTCLIHGALEHPNGGFLFQEVAPVQVVLRDLSLSADLPFEECTGTRECTMALMKRDESKLVVNIASHRREQEKLTGTQLNAQKNPIEPITSATGWILDKKRTSWMKVFNLAVQDEVEKNENYDDLVRHVISETKEDRGWRVRGSTGHWRDEPLVHVNAALASQGSSGPEIRDIIGTQVIQAWTLVSKPFQPEYPGNREWNLNAAQIAFTPSAYADPENFQTWTRVLEHCGSGLTSAIQQDDWCKRHNILTGGDYLRLWIASVLKEPYAPLPYLFFYSGEQDTGKSTFHVACNLLLTRGFMRADNALGNTSFNGEIADAIICAVEETDLRSAKLAYNKIKDWVTSPEILIHPKGITPFLIRNTTHWIQCSNNPLYCPIFPGDTRVTMINVPVLTEIIPPTDLLTRLKEEAPNFLGYLLKMELPASGSRLNIPIITTNDKMFVQESNKTSLEMFLNEHCYYVEGSAVIFAEFFEKFQSILDRDEISRWSKMAVSRAIPMKFPRGKLSNNLQAHIGNMSFEPSEHKGPAYYNDGTQILKRR